jgi:hypothetical protein
MKERSMREILWEKAITAARASLLSIPPFISLMLDAHSMPHPGDTAEFGIRAMLEHMPCTSLTLVLYIGVAVAGYFYCVLTEPSLIEECAERAIRLNGEERRAWFKKIEKDLGPEFLEKVIASL